MDIVIRKGAGTNEIDLGDLTFDLNSMSPKAFNICRRDIKKGLRELQKVKQDGKD